MDGIYQKKLIILKYDIDNALLIDNTGAFTDKDSLSRHLSSKGVSKVLLTAPGKGIPNIVYGINSKNLNIETNNIFFCRFMYYKLYSTYFTCY